MAQEATTLEADREERDVARLRDRVEQTVEELERRGRELLDWRLQLRKHALAIGLGLGVGVLALGLIVGLPIGIAARRRAKRAWWQR